MPSQRLLLVDDEEAHRAALVGVLQAAGYEVVEARNGLHALQQLMQPPLPALILLDMIMPVMTGFEFLDIKAEDPRIRDVPVIAITAHAKVGDLPGVRRLVEKPFDARQLVALIGDVLAT